MTLSRTAIDALLADNTAGDITAQDMRDVSAALYDVGDLVAGDRLTLTDFVGGGNDVSPFTSSNASGGQTNRAAVDGTEWGVFDFFTGANASGRGALFGGVTSIAFGTNEFRLYSRLYVPTLSTTAEAFTVICGFGDVVATANQTDAAYFLYDTEGVSAGSASSANWQVVTSSNSVRTFTTSATAVALNTWMNIEIRVNAAASSVAFLLNGTEVATAHTTNIPTGTARVTGPVLRILKSAGTGSRNVYADYFGVRRMG